MTNVLDPTTLDPHLRQPYVLEPTHTVVVTATLVHELAEDHTVGWVEREILRCADRHFRGDWGNLDLHDKRMNELALATGDRLLSTYEIDGTKVYIITDAGHEVTTIMRRCDY